MVKYSEERLINKLIQLKNKLGKTPTIKNIRKEKNFPSYISYYTHFGSWNKALESANLLKNFEYRSYSNEELLNFLIEFKTKNGRSPKTNDFDKNDNLPASITYFKRFGSWNNALKLSGLKINVRKD